MSKNLKKRIYTSIILTLFLFLSITNNFILGYFLIITGIISLLEFFKMTGIAFEKQKIKQILYKSFFTTYLVAFCSGILIFSSFLHLKILIFVILVTCIASDIGGFVVGKLLKGRKLTKLSPNKTISGAIGSIIFSLVAISLLIYFLTKNFELSILILGFTISISCQLGDLFFSFIKRKSKLKDTGNFLPGHGGVLDRIDGMLLGIPVGFLTLLIIY